MTRIRKAWGFVTPLLEEPRLVLHRLEIESGFSSLHAHQFQWNRFYVRSGRIAVSVSCRGGWVYSEVGPGSIVDVPPRTLHRFAVLQPGVVWEVYWPEDRVMAATPCDIVRLDEGGDAIPTDNRVDGLFSHVYQWGSRVREFTPTATGLGESRAISQAPAAVG